MLFTYQRVWEAFNFIIFNVSKYDDDGEQFITLLVLFYIIFLKLTHKSPSLQQSGANFDERITKLNHTFLQQKYLFSEKLRTHFTHYLFICINANNTRFYTPWLAFTRIHTRKKNFFITIILIYIIKRNHNT